MRQAKYPDMGPTRFRRIFARDSVATELLQGCPVVTADGRKIGDVEALLIDRRTHQLRYVLLSRQESFIGKSADIAIPWHTLYFDSAMARLVFYTYTSRGV
ncbi:MAG TPA: PRC-barrel domain-containing protein [Burkholderiaceae bacterium]|nr:PRC-barrel domain-containing protein [Burkholderiaceae bacterium]